MNRMNLTSRIAAWTMVIAMLPWSSFVSGDERYIVPSITNESYISKDEDASEGDAKISYDLPEVEENVEEEELILEDYVVSESVILDKDIEVKSLFIDSRGDLDLNGHSLICHGDIRLYKNADLKFNNGEILCSGSFKADQQNCKIEMTSKNDRLVVDGRLDIVYGIFNFTNGTVEAKGDVNVTSYFNASGDNTFIFSGNGKQVLSQTEGSKFNNVILNNYSEYGIEVSNVFNYSTLQQNGCRMELLDQDGILGYTLTEDEEKDGLFILKTGTLDLNGHTLIVNGDLIQAGGKLKINNGKLIVNGNYRIQKRQVNGDNIRYLTSTGILEMTGEDDYIKVLNDFIVDSSKNTKGYLSDGTIEVLGNISIDNSKNLTGFYPTGRHSVIMTSDYPQIIEFKGENKKSCSHLNNLKINNTSEEGVSFDAPACISGSFDQGDSKVTGDLICVGDTEFVKGEYAGNISFLDISKITGDLNLTGKLTSTYELTVNGDVSVSGDIINNSTMVIKGILSTEGNYIESGNTYVSGTLNVSGNCETAKKELRTFILTEGQVSVGKDVNNIVFSMESDKDYVSIGGNYSTLGNFYETYYKKGVVEIKGDVNAPAFKASGDHKLILSGDKLQTITNADQMTIGILELNNKSEDGVFFDKVVSKSKLIRNDCRIRFGNLEGEFGWTLEDDQEISGDLILIDDELNLNGHNLHITGDLIQMSGTININGGELTVDGDYRMQSKNSAEDENSESNSYDMSTASLKMTNENDKVIINGDFYIWTKNSNYERLTNGELVLEGDLYIAEDSNSNAFYGTENFKLVLAGKNDQNLYLNSRSIYSPIFEINCSGKTTSDGTIYVDKELVTSYDKEYDGIIHIKESTKITGDGFRGSLYLGSSYYYRNYVFENRFHVGGDFYSNVGIYAKNGLDIEGSFYCSEAIKYAKDSYVGGDLINKENRYLNVTVGSDTTLSVHGDFDLNKNGYIVLDDKTSTIIVNGNFSHNNVSNISTGKIYVGGDFTGYGFNASNDNVVILNGNKQQTMNVSRSTRFATLELDNSSEEGVVAKSVFQKDKFNKNNTKFSYDGIEGVSGYKLSKDEVYDGDFILLEDVLDLNGHTLTVNGDFIQLSGTVNINEGKLIISGDYRQESSKEAKVDISKKDFMKYQNYICHSELIMQHEDDYVEIGGDFIINTAESNYNNQTDGKINLKGNLIYFSIYNNYGFMPTRNFCLILSGEKQQSIINYYRAIGINVLSTQLQLPSLVIDTNDSDYVLNGSGITISNSLDTGNAKVKTQITLLQGSKIVNDVYYGNLIINTDIDKNLTVIGSVSGSPKVSGTLEIGESLNISKLEINSGKVSVNGSAKITNIIMNSGELCVTGNLSTNELKMNHNDDLVIVDGSFTNNGGTSYHSSFSKGELYVGGDFNNTEKSLRYSKDHRIILNGKEKQIINSPYGHLGTVELRNYSSEGIYSDSVFRYEELIKNGCKLTYGFEKTTDGFVLDGDYTHTGNLLFIDGEIDLNGHTLTVDGDLIHVGGKINLNGGKLIINKDLREQSPNGNNYVEGQGTLSMTDDQDIIIVNGDCYLDSNNISEMKTGSLYVSGNLKRTISSKNFDIGTRIILDSKENQSIDANILGLSSVEFDTKGKLTIGCSGFNVNKYIKSTCKDITGSISVQSLNVIESPYYGDVILRTSDSLSKDVDIIGTLSVDNKLEIKDKSLSVRDFVICDEGYLIMNDADGYISVSNDMKIDSTVNYYYYSGNGKSILTDGIIEIHGNFDCKRDSNFTASDNHRVIFYPKKRKSGSLLKQSISFGSNSGRTSRFNILELKGDFDNYRFYNELDSIANEVIYESEEVAGLKPVTELCVKNATVNTVTITYKDTNTEAKAAGYEIYRNGVMVGVTDRTEYTDRNLKPYTQYSYTVAAFDENKNHSDESESISAQTLKDTDPPTVPNGLHITNRTGSDITLAWTGSRDNIGVAGYILYRNGEPVGDKITSYEYIDKDVKQDEIYTYELSAIDAAGNESLRSDSVSAEIVMPTISRVIPADYKRIGENSVELKAYYKNYGSGSRNSVDFEYQNANNEWVKINDAPVGQTQSRSSEYVSSCNWNIGHLESGSVNVRYTLTDSSGARDEFITEYEIDHTAPDSPEDIKISDDNGVAVLTWKVSGESDLSKYNIYRYIINENDSEEVYTKIAEISDKFSARYEDNTLGLSDSAKYIVTAEDDLGNNSPLINPVSISVGNDEIPPAITEIYPDVERIAGKTDITAYAKDNKEVSDISFYILSVEDKDNSKEWKLLDKVQTSIDNENRFYSTYTFDSTAYIDGDYYIAAKAEDHSENISIEETYKRYEIDNSGITKISINNTNAGSTYIQLMWDDVDDSDFGCFLVEQKIGPKFEEVARIYDVTGCTIENLTPETKYSFRVCGVDTLGNKGEYSDVVNVSTSADTSAPSITAVYPVQGSVKDSIPLSMTVTDNYKVASGTWSLSFDGNEYEPIYTAKGNKATVNLSYKFDVSDPEKYPEGKIYIKFEAVDAYGNESLKTQDGSDIVMEYIIDRTAPVMVKNVSAAAHDGYIAITWDEGTEEDISRYKVYRADAEKNNFKCVMNEASLNFYDTSIEDGESYSYYVTALDEAGNESEKSNITYATAIPDETAPKVGGVSPLDGSKIGAEQKFQIIVTDNSNLSNVKTYYRTDENDSWTLLNEMRASGRSALLSFSADLKNEEEGDIFFKTICEDKNGNISDDFIYTCTLDKTPPKAQFIAEGGNFEINISVKKDILEPDISYCEIYRCELSNSSKNMDFFRNAQSIKKLSLETVNIDGTKQGVVRFTDTEVTPHTAYRYAAKVYDKVGNYSWTEISNATATSIDDKPPTIVAPDKITTIVGMEVGFDAGDSSDNVKIKSFAWDLGNGDKATGARPKYRYNASGKYNVKLKVTDASGNSSEKDIEVQVKEASDNGICNLTVVDYQGNPIPYAYVYIKAGADSNTTFMTDAYGKISLCYKSGTYSVAAYKEGYLPEEQEYKITNMKTTEEILKLSSGEVVVGKFEVVRMSLQEIVDSGVDLSNPANLNTFTFKTTLTFEKQPIPVYVDSTPGDIAILGSGDNGRPGGSTESPFGEGKGKPIPVYVSTYVDQVENNVPGIPPVPIIAVMSTTQTVSWLKTMYSANLTIMNKADSQYVINDAKGSIELPDGVSFAVLGEDKRRETGTASGQSEVIDMGDIAGQEQKTVSWVLKGDKSGEYQIKARFDGLLSPFNVPVEKNFIAYQQMEVEQADVEIVVKPENALYLDEDYYVQFYITNKGNEPLYNFTTSIGDYRVPKDKSVVYTMDPDTGDIIGMDTSGGGLRYKLPLDEQIYHMPVLSGEDQISIPTLMPGQTIMGTWKRGEGNYKENGLAGDTQREYFKLINTMVEVLEGENLGVKVYVQPIGSHVSKIITASYKEEDVVINLGDPVDVTSGAFLDTYNAINLSGKGTLSYDLSYDSVIAGDEYTMPDGLTTGMGWTGSFDSHIVEQNGLIKYYTNPYAYTLFITDDSYNGKLYGHSDSEYDPSITATQTDALADQDLSKAEITLVEPDNSGSDIKYVPVTHGMEGFSLIKHDDGSYTLISPIDEEIDYDSIGRIKEIRMSDGSVTDFNYNDNTTKIEEVQSGNSILIRYDNEKIASVSGGDGRTTSFEYDNNGDLIKIVDALGNAITYEYDDNHHIIAEKNSSGETFISNTYDESGRVITQTDSYGSVINFNYSVDESGNLTATAVKKADGYPDAETTVVSDIRGHIIDVTYPSGAHESYSYDDNGNVISVTNGYGNTTSLEYDSENRLISSSGIEGRNYSVDYDEKGNITSVNSPEGDNGIYTYDENGKLISATVSGATTNYSYASDGTLSEEERVGKGSRKYASSNGLLSSTTDELGYTTAYKYDKAGNLTELTDPNGNKHLFAYNAINQKTSYTDALGNTTTYTYDSYNNITSETDPLGSVYRYEYDVAGNLTKIIRPDGSELKLTYDMNGNMSEVTCPDGTAIRYSYDLAGNNTGVSYPDGSSEEYTYDKNNNLISSKDRAGNVTEYTIDSSIEKPVAVKDILGNVMDYGYDNNGYISSVKHSQGFEYAYSHDKSGNILSVTDSLGHTTGYEYNEWNELVKETDYRGNVTEYSYDAAGNCIEKKLPTGLDIHYEYDKNYNVIKVSTVVGGKDVSESYTYDGMGNVLTYTDTMGRVTSYAYDKCNRLLSETAPDGTISTYSYDSLGNLNEVTSSDNTCVTVERDSMGRIVSVSQNGTEEETSKIYKYTYDQMGQLVSTIDPMGKETSQTYDVLGNVLSTKDAEGGETSYTYDKTGNLIAEKNAIGCEKTYSYDSLGRIISETDAEGHEISYTYDDYGRLIKVQDTDGVINLNYDEYGNLSEINDKNGTIAYGYDNFGRITEVTDARGKTVKYSYDEIGNVISLTYPGGEIVRYEYNADGSVASVTDGKNRTTKYSYDSVGRLSKTEKPDGSIDFKTYNESGFMISDREVDSKGEAILNYEYGYDSFGNITSIRNCLEDGEEISYSAEANGFGAAVTENGENTVTSISMEYNSANQLIKYNGNEIKYDKNGNMIYGPLDGEMTEFEYDCRNRLIRAGDIRYTYDADGVRISAETDEYIEYYVVDRVSDLSQILQIERVYKNQNENNQDDSSDKIVNYYYGLGLIYEDSDTGLMVYHYDHQGSIRKITDESGEILYNFTYGTYGEILSIWHKGDEDNLSVEDINRNHPIRFLYNGALGVVTDDNTLCSMRQRYYNTEIKRFINQDILYGDATNSQSLNRYAYVQGNPINYNDPFGLSPIQVLQSTLTPIHDILNIAGIIPGPIGALADLGNAFLYSLEGKSEMATRYVVQAFVTSIAIPIGGTVIGGLCGVSKIVKFTVGFALMGAGAFTILTSFPGFVQNFRNLKAELSKEDKNYLNILHYGSGFISDAAGIIYGINSMYGGFTVMFGKCFVAGTKIKTEDGDKNIEDIEVGDRVYSYNPETGEEGYKTVKRTFVKESDEIVHVTITNADKSESVTIDATPGHPFYVVGYGFKYASELKIGDKLRSVSGDIYEVTDTAVEHFAIPIKVYNFEVEDWHTYAVSEVGIVVHNSKGYVESSSDEQTTERPSEPQPNTGTVQTTTAQQGVSGVSDTEIILCSKPHTNGTEGHWETILSKVDKLKKTGKYIKIYVNKGLSNILPGAKPNRRPDIMGVTSDGVVDQFEIPSKTDSPEKLIERMLDNQKILRNESGEISIIRIGDE